MNAEIRKKEIATRGGSLRIGSFKCPEMNRRLIPASHPEIDSTKNSSDKPINPTEMNRRTGSARFPLSNRREEPIRIMNSAARGTMGRAPGTILINRGLPIIQPESTRSPIKIQRVPVRSSKKRGCHSRCTGAVLFASAERTFTFPGESYSERSVLFG